MRVKDLWLLGVKVWNETLIQHVFPQEMAHMIFTTPLNPLVEEGRRIWTPVPTGAYSVKTTNHLATNDMIENDHSCQEGDLMLIWKMKAPPLIKNILWRACRGCLLTCGQLYQRGISCPIICTMCGTQVVNSWHLFFDCATSVECWQEQGLWEQISTIMSQASSFKDVCFKALSQFDSVLRAVFATTFWAIWRCVMISTG